MQVGFDVVKGKTKPKRKRKQWLESVHNDTFGLKIYVGVGSLSSLAAKAFGEEQPGSYSDLDKFAAVCAYGGGDIGLFFRNDTEVTYNMIFHECSHGAFRAAEYCGWGLNKETNEPYAYFSGWLGDQCLKLLLKHGEKIQTT